MYLKAADMNCIARSQFFALWATFEIATKSFLVSLSKPLKLLILLWGLRYSKKQMSKVFTKLLSEANLFILTSDVFKLEIQAFQASNEPQEPKKKLDFELQLGQKSLNFELEHVTISQFLPILPFEVADMLNAYVSCKNSSPLMAPL